MDKNTIYGFVLIALILVGFSVLNRPNEQELAKQKRYNDSIAFVEQNKMDAIAAQKKNATDIKPDSLSNTDSTSVAQSNDAFGAFSVAATGEEKFYILENELVKLRISNKGGRVYSAQLKNFQTHDSLPLVLFDGQESKLGFTVVTNNNRVVHTLDLYFEPVQPVKKDAKGNQVLTLRLKTTGEAYIDFTYTLLSDNYMRGFAIKANAMNTIMPGGTNFLEMK